MSPYSESGDILSRDNTDHLDKINYHELNVYKSSDVLQVTGKTFTSFVSFTMGT